MTPTITTDSVQMATEMSVPDKAFQDLQFQKSEAQNARGINSVDIQTQLAAPKKPIVVNTCDKTMVGNCALISLLSEAVF